ncbi:hypothetical protein ACFYMQ_29560, partial [Streptomyces sp. NPDC007063]
MEIAELVLKYVKALAWPLTVGALAWCLRSYLRDAFARMTRLETPAGSIEFEVETRLLRERAEELSEGSIPEPRSQP